jgi:hypothetical protein
MTCAPTATRTRDLPLRRSFRALRSTAAMLLSAGPFVVQVPLDVLGFYPLLARDWHGRSPRRETGVSSDYALSFRSTLQRNESSSDL